MKLLERLREARAGQDQQKLVRLVEAIGDVLVSEARQQKDSCIETGLGHIQQILQRLLDMRARNPGKFDRLFYSPEYQMQEEDDDDIWALAMSLSHGRAMPPFSAVLGQLIRIHKTGLEVDSDEVARLCVDKLTWLLAQLCATEGTGLLVENVARHIYQAMQAASARQSPSTHISAYRWYTDIVFEGRDHDVPRLRLEYLPTLNQYFDEVVRHLIRENWIHGRRTSRAWRHSCGRT